MLLILSAPGQTGVWQGLLAAPPGVLVTEDGDGICDVDDNCPEGANPDQLNSDSDAEVREKMRKAKREKMAAQQATATCQ